MWGYLDTRSRGWLVVYWLATVLGCSANAAAGLRAGAGKADLTPRTGYYLGGWTRADRVAQGQHTRLHARALVLKRGDRKVALVAVDPGALDAVEDLARHGHHRDARVGVPPVAAHSSRSGLSSTRRCRYFAARRLISS